MAEAIPPLSWLTSGPGAPSGKASIGNQKHPQVSHPSDSDGCETCGCFCFGRFYVLFHSYPDVLGLERTGISLTCAA